MTYAGVLTYSRRTDVVEQGLGPETILFTPQMQAVHVLNATAQVLWELCDGHHGRADMEQALRERFRIPSRHDVRAEIEAALAALLAKGLITATETPA